MPSFTHCRAVWIIPTFPFQAILIEEPGSDYARQHMTVGNEYKVTGQGGSCYEVSADLPGDTTLIWRGRLMPVPPVINS